MPATRNHDEKRPQHAHLHVRSNGVIYTTAEEVLADPEVRAAIRRTGKLMREVKAEKERERRESE